MEPLWITLKICAPIIVIGTLFYLYRLRLSALFRRGLQRKFYPAPFRPSELTLTVLSFGYAVFALMMIWGSEPFSTGVLYVSTVFLGTIILAIVRTPFRSFYTLLFSTVILIGLQIGGAMRKQGKGLKWTAEDTFGFAVFAVFLVLLPTVLAWVVTLVRDDEHRI